MSLEWERAIVAARAPAGLWTVMARDDRVVVVNDAPDEVEIRSTPDRTPGRVRSGRRYAGAMAISMGLSPTGMPAPTALLLRLIG